MKHCINEQLLTIDSMKNPSEIATGVCLETLVTAFTSGTDSEALDIYAATAMGNTYSHRTLAHTLGRTDQILLLKSKYPEMFV